ERRDQGGRPHPRLSLAQDRLRRDPVRHPRRHRGQARRLHALRHRPQLPGGGRQPPAVRRGARGPRPDELRRHRDPPVLNPLPFSRPRKETPVTTTSAARPAITVTGLQKSFGDKVVLDGIDLVVQEGTIFALLGPNGAGKTTTVHILSTLIPADGGEVQVAGHDVAAEANSVRAAIGVTGQFSAVDNLLTGEEDLLPPPAPPHP